MSKIRQVYVLMRVDGSEYDNYRSIVRIYLDRAEAYNISKQLNLHAEELINKRGKLYSPQHNLEISKLVYPNGVFNEQAYKVAMEEVDRSKMTSPEMKLFDTGGNIYSNWEVEESEIELSD